MDVFASDKSFSHGQLWLKVRELFAEEFISNLHFLVAAAKMRVYGFVCLLSSFSSEIMSLRACLICIHTSSTQLKMRSFSIIFFQEHILKFQI